MSQLDKQYVFPKLTRQSSTLNLNINSERQSLHRQRRPSRLRRKMLTIFLIEPLEELDIRQIRINLDNLIQPRPGFFKYSPQIINTKLRLLLDTSAFKLPAWYDGDLSGYEDQICRGGDDFGLGLVWYLYISELWCLAGRVGEVGGECWGDSYIMRKSYISRENPDQFKISQSTDI